MGRARIYPAASTAAARGNTPPTGEELRVFYRYFDLCNEQIFQRQQDRITDKTWTQWNDGIRSILNRPGLTAAWLEIEQQNQAGDFNELRWFIAHPGADPKGEPIAGS